MKLPSVLFFFFFLLQPYLHVNIEDNYLRSVFGLVQDNKKTKLQFPFQMDGEGFQPLLLIQKVDSELGMNMARSFPLKSVLRVV